MTENIDRATDVIHDTVQEWPQDDVAGVAAHRLADAGLLRPDPSSRYDGEYGASFGREEYAEDGAHIEASVTKHYPAPKWKTVHRADVHIDIDGRHGHQTLNVYATAEWCREAAAILLDVADEVDRNNKETADHAEEADRADA